MSIEDLREVKSALRGRTLRYIFDVGNSEVTYNRFSMVLKSLIIIIIIITLFKSQWIGPSIVALLIEETVNQTESQQIK